MSDIFISYASEDRAQAKTLAEALIQQGWSVWWDRTIPIGRTFAEVIEDELGKARCVVVLWSQLSVKKNWVMEEASGARERGILAPVFIENVTHPLGFRRFQAASLVKWNGKPDTPEFQKLINDLTCIVKNSPGVEEAIREVPLRKPEGR